MDGPLVESLGMNYANIPMSPNAPVREGDKEFCLRNLPNAIRFIADNSSIGPVLVHCRSGKDRTGIVLAASLIAFEKIDPEKAMEEVINVRSIAFSARGWMAFGKEVLGEFHSQNKSINYALSGPDSLSVAPLQADDR